MANKSAYLFPFDLKVNGSYVRDNSKYLVGMYTAMPKASISTFNFEDYESLNFFQRVLQKSGVFEALEAKGCRDGHTVSIYDFEFEFVK